MPTLNKIENNPVGGKSVESMGQAANDVGKSLGWQELIKRKREAKKRGKEEKNYEQERHGSYVTPIAPLASRKGGTLSCSKSLMITLRIFDRGEKGDVLLEKLGLWEVREIPTGAIAN